MKKITNFWKDCGRLAAFAAAVFLSHPALALVGQPVPGATGLQEAASPLKEKMHHFYNDLMLPIIIAISVFVFILLVIVVVRFNAKANPVPAKFTHNTMLEVAWTLVPVLILIVIVIPSMKMLYYSDRTTEAELTIKAIGNQWYWDYEYPDNGISFAANMIAEKDLQPGQVRLLETDNPVVVPVDTNIKVLTAANDVIHSWAVPAFGVKLDAVPGRLNETWMRVEKEGTFYGQCSQLCGQNHAYMPIQIKAVSKEAFNEWVKKQGGHLAGAVPTPAAATDAAQAAADNNKPIVAPAGKNDKAAAPGKNEKAAAPAKNEKAATPAKDKTKKKTGEKK